MEDKQRNLWIKVRDYWYSSNDSMLDKLLEVSDFGGIYQRLKEVFPEITVDAIAEIVHDEMSFDDYMKGHPEGILDKEVTDKDTVLEAVYDINEDRGFLHSVPCDKENLKKIIKLCRENPEIHLAEENTEAPNVKYIYRIHPNKHPAHIGTIIEYPFDKNKIYLDNPTLKDFIKDLEDKPSYLEDYSKWDETEGKQKRVSDYRKLAHISDDVKITEENIDEHALNKTCFINYNYPKDKLIKELIN